jgi:thioesterase domain-containing protein
MTAAHLLEQLRRLDVHVELDGDRLRLNAPAGVLTDEHKHDLAMRKAELIEFLREARQLATQQRGIVPLQPAGTRTPIFAVAGHNGDVFAYRVLTQHLGQDQPFYGLQPPGLEPGTVPLTRIEDIARYFADQIRQFRPTGPLSVAGFCAGGTIAFELARQLAETGTPVTNLILFGAPHCRSYRPLGWLTAVAQEGARRSAYQTRALRAVPARDRVRYMSNRTRELLQRRAEKATDPFLIRRHGVERATMAAARAYSPQPFGCHLDVVVPCESWTRSWARPLRWGRYADSTTEFIGPDDCTTDTMLLPEHAATISAFVVEAQRRHASESARREA